MRRLLEPTKPKVEQQQEKLLMVKVIKVIIQRPAAVEAVSKLVASTVVGVVVKLKRYSSELRCFQLVALEGCHHTCYPLLPESLPPFHQLINPSTNSSNSRMNNNPRSKA